MNNIIKNKKGFTLAEVLVTLAVIGVVASITIPPLVTNIQQEQYKQAWKKAFATIADATDMIRAKNISGPYAGTMKGLCTTQFDDECFKSLFLPYLKYNKSCNEGQSVGNCWPTNVKALDGTSNGYQFPTIILNNGMFFMFRHHHNLCDYFGYTSFSTCGWIGVDVNGFNPPNILGKDIFTTFILDKSVKPSGSQGDTHGCEGSTGIEAGWACSAKYLYQ